MSLHFGKIRNSIVILRQFGFALSEAQDKNCRRISTDLLGARQATEALCA